jgi:hypothetical protein
MNGLMNGTGVLLENDENALWDLERADFPVTLYDRPGLALSNLLLRGNVDAATRAIFSPQTLTPAEMKTFSGMIVGNSKSKLLKTVADIVTNPLVLLGAVMAIKYPIGKSNVIAEIGAGLAKGKPGPLMAAAQSAFNNLRNVPHAYRALSEMAKETGNMIDDYGRELNSVFTSYVAKTRQRLTESDMLKVVADVQGFNVAVGKTKQVIKGQELLGLQEVPEKARGLRKAVSQVYKILPEGEPLWPGLQGQMSPELRKFSAGIKGWFSKFNSKFTEDPEAWKAFKAEMAGKGYDVNIGDFMEHYFPIQAKFSPLEGVAAKDLMGPDGFHLAIGKAGKGVASALRPALGVTIGDLNQIRKMEKLGMTPVADKILASIQQDAVHMNEFLHSAWNGVKEISNPIARAEAFSQRVLEQAAKTGLNTRMRLGPGKMAEVALKQVSSQLDSVSLYPDRLKDKIAGIADVLVRPAQYDMRIAPVASRYLTQMASSWAYHMAPVADTLSTAVASVYPGIGGTVRGYKKLLEPIMDAAKASPDGGGQYTYMRDQLLPMLRGLKPHNAYARATIWGDYKDKMGMWLATHPLAKKLPESSRAHLMNFFSNFNNVSSESLGAKVSEFFYVSTLGLNIAPASKNLLQNYVTLLHTPGINRNGLMAGMSEMTKGIGNYVSMLSGGMSRDDAWLKAFPDYVKATGKAAGMTHAMKLGDVATEGLASKISMGGVKDKIKDVMLTPFATSEAFNRLFGFYVAKNSYLATHGTGAMDAAIEFGGNINQVAHFTGGPLGMPKALLGMWGPARQFMHFPLRYAGFLGESTQWAEGLGKYRTLATSAGASAAAYSAVKNLMGVDISSGLMTGALPMPSYEKSPFYPWPLVPPGLAVAGEAVRSVATGDMEGMKRSAALLVPGGIALRRLYKTLGPKYADYNNPTEDGRVPVYNDQKALVGAFTPWQLTMKSLGLAPTSQQAEYGAAKWLLTQREKIRGYRRDYLEAISDNDIRRAEQINTQFQKAYPEMGPLQVKKADITAIHNRREVSRLQRILKGFPKDYQPLFGHMVSQAGLAGITQQLESQPSPIDEYSQLLNQ